jgi:hypothetical protein
MLIYYKVLPKKKKKEKKRKERKTIHGIMGRLEKNIIHAMGTKDLMEYICNVNKKKRKTQN